MGKALKAATQMQYADMLISNAILWYYFLWIYME